MKPHSDFHNAQQTKKVVRSKLDEPKVKAALLQWLFTDNLTYQAAKAKLLSEFNLNISESSLSKFWQRHIKPATTEATVITLKLTIRASGPVAVQVEQGGQS